MEKWQREDLREVRKALRQARKSERFLKKIAKKVKKEFYKLQYHDIFDGFNDAINIPLGMLDDLISAFEVNGYYDKDEKK